MCWIYIIIKVVKVIVHKFIRILGGELMALLLIVTVLLFVYLFYVLFNPEKF